MPGPAYRIQTPRLVIRCWNPADAPLLQEAVTASVEHLRPWMPWVHGEPEELEVKVQRLRQFRASFDTDGDYVYAIFDAAEREVVPRKLGYTLEATLRRNVRGVDDEMRDTQVWSLLRAEYPASPSASAPLEAFDAAGRRLL